MAYRKKAGTMKKTAGKTQRKQTNLFGWPNFNDLF
jgi:hypothetical protein